jgi:hypothetical protein
VVACQEDYLAVVGGFGAAEGVFFALDHQYWDVDSGELGQARFLGLAWWVEREGQAEDRDCLALLRCAAGDAGAGGAAAEDHGQVREPAFGQIVYDREPGFVELAGWGWGAAAGDAVGLFDQGDMDACGSGAAGGRDQVWGADAAAGAVAQ